MSDNTVYGRALEKLKECRAPIIELEAELGKLPFYPNAEAALAEMTTYRDNARQQMEWLRDERDTARAALAERDRMLELAEERVLRVLPTFSPTTAKLIRKVFADLRAQKP